MREEEGKEGKKITFIFCQGLLQLSQEFRFQFNNCLSQCACIIINNGWPDSAGQGRALPHWKPCSKPLPSVAVCSTAVQSSAFPFIFLCAVVPYQGVQLLLPHIGQEYGFFNYLKQQKNIFNKKTICGEKDHIWVALSFYSLFHFFI